MWGPIIQVLEDRKKRIADGLAFAERANHELELGRKKAVDIIREARNSASQMIEQAKLRAHEIVANAEIEARAEGERQVIATKAGVEVEMTRAREQLRQQVAALAVAGAERILRKEIDVRNHEEMLTRLAAKL
jgi:F-type H+-transporting ATPase subunit b